MLKPIIYALLAALFYAVNIPLSKVLLAQASPAMMAALLYLGAGLGIGIFYIAAGKKTPQEKLSRQDLPYTAGMVLLDIAAPILLMFGISMGASSNASLLGNFEIAATTLIALFIFKEKVSWRLWAGIALISIASAVLTFEGADSLRFSLGSVFVLLAASCWGLENNCTRKISSKNTYQIVMVKGIFSGLGSLSIAFFMKESLPGFDCIAYSMMLGFVSYGLSIFMYVRAQNWLGAAKTSAYYSAAPFMGAFLAFAFLGEKLSAGYAAALIIMLCGTAFVIADTLVSRHEHKHRHLITHSHGGVKHTHYVEHSHPHDHYLDDSKHRHAHSEQELSLFHSH